MMDDRPKQEYQEPESQYLERLRAWWTGQARELLEPFYSTTPPARAQLHVHARVGEIMRECDRLKGDLNRALEGTAEFAESMNRQLVAFERLRGLLEKRRGVADEG